MTQLGVHACGPCRERPRTVDNHRQLGLPEPLNDRLEVRAAPSENVHVGRLAKALDQAGSCETIGLDRIRRDRRHGIEFVDHIQNIGDRSEPQANRDLMLPASHDDFGSESLSRHHRGRGVHRELRKTRPRRSCPGSPRSRTRLAARHSRPERRLPSGRSPEPSGLPRPQSQPR